MKLKIGHNSFIVSRLRPEKSICIKRMVRFKRRNELKRKYRKIIGQYNFSLSNLSRSRKGGEFNA